ncbi:helix-turn-helix domain-containing protein [Halorutilales archaeon Cl-col2-1]
MVSGVRVELTVGKPQDCPVAEVSSEGGESGAVSKAVTPDGKAVEEFTYTENSVGKSEKEVDEVFSYGSENVYRFERDTGIGCVCEVIEEAGCPVSDVKGDNGSLLISFHAPDVDTLKDITTELRNEFSDISLQRLVRTEDEGSKSDLAFVDRSALTQRQTEVLRKAHEMGYFEYPKGANAKEVADELGISASTFSEHLSAAQNKILGALLDD